MENEKKTLVAQSGDDVMSGLKRPFAADIVIKP
jgi:hypothetical protein